MTESIPFHHLEVNMGNGGEGRRGYGGDRKRLVGIRDQGGEPWDRKRHALSCRVARVLSDFITRTNY